MTRDGLQKILERYLPHKDGRHPVQRLHAITQAVYNDRTRKIAPPLTASEAQDLHAHMLEHAVRSIHRYEPDLDTNPDVPLDIRFGRYLARTVDQRATDWLRKHRSDPRPGRIKKTWVTIDGFIDGPGSKNTTHNHDLGNDSPDAADRHERMFSQATDPFVERDFTDAAVSRIRVDRWAEAAQRRGLTVQEYVSLAADQMADLDLRDQAA